jgi:hypothetical protein
MEDKEASKVEALNEKKLVDEVKTAKRMKTRSSRLLA